MIPRILLAIALLCSVYAVIQATGYGFAGPTTAALAQNACPNGVCR
jgi:hypothetical protein